MAAPRAADPRSTTALSSDATQAPRTATIGRYLVEDSIGTGGMGEVFRAYDPVLRREVALKHCKLADSQRTQSLLREARLASQLQHPAVVSIFDVFEYDGEPVIVQEFVRGAPLTEHLRSGRPLALGAFFVIAEECASALEAAEAHGIVHCDLKPGNIIVDPDGHGHVLDFGIARTCGLPEPVATAEMLRFAGTPAYMAPERIRGKDPTPAADIFSLGVVFYEMLTGTHPFKQPSVSATIDRILMTPPPAPRSLNQRIPRELDRLVMAMLAKDPTARPEGAGDLLRALRDMRARRARRRRDRWFEGVAIAGLLVAGAAVIHNYHDFFRRPEWPADGLRLVVQDFEAKSADPDDTIFASGLTDWIGIRLAGFGSFQVYPESTKVKPDLELGGMVQRDGERIRVHYRVAERARNRTLLGDVVEGSAKDTFEIQDRVADSVARSLARRYQLQEPVMDRSRPTLDVTAWDLYQLGRGYLSRYEEEASVKVAIEQFEKALARDPQFALAMAGLGEAYWKRYEATHDTTWTRQAEAVALAAAEAGPGLAEVHVTLGNVYQATGRTEAAGREFRRALELNPRSEAAYRGLAQIEETQGHFAVAEATYKKAIGALPGYWAPHNQLGVFYYRQGRLAEASEAFARVVELTPDNARGWTNLGGMNARLGQDSTAIAAYEKSLAVSPSFEAYTNLGTLYLNQGRFADAASSYQQAIVISPGHYEIWGDLGSTLSRIPGREAAGDSAIERAIALARVELAVNPHDAALLSRLAQYEAFSGHSREAKKLAARAYKLGRGQPEVLWYVAGVFEGLGDRDRALSAVREALVAGYPADVMRQEADTADLIADPRFAEIVAEVEATREK